jgi:hypothetical protein
MQTELELILTTRRVYPRAPRLAPRVVKSWGSDDAPWSGRQYVLGVRYSSDEEREAILAFWEHHPAALCERSPRNRPKHVRELVAAIGWTPTADEEALIDSLAGLTTVVSV